MHWRGSLFGKIADPGSLHGEMTRKIDCRPFFIRANVALVAPRRQRLTGRADRLLPRAARIPDDGWNPVESRENLHLRDSWRATSNLKFHCDTSRSRCKHCLSSRITPLSENGDPQRARVGIRRRSLSFRSDHVPGRLRWVATNRGRGVETRVKSAMERADGPRTQGSLSLS